VLTVSDFSKREIVRCFGTDPSKIDVIYSARRRRSPRPRPNGIRAADSNRRCSIVARSSRAGTCPSSIEGFGRLAGGAAV
jgi:hypothetical protein